MIEEMNSYFEKINCIFSEGYAEAYKNLSAKGKNKVLTYLTAIYRRWYYSAGVENTLLTPANMILSLNEDYDAAALHAPSVFLKEPTGMKGFFYKSNRYSLDEHPMVSDFNFFLASCDPDVNLTSEGFLTKEHVHYLFDKMSLCDPHYIDYLRELALQMGCIKNSPAIHLLKVQTTTKREEIIRLKHKDALGKMASAALTLAADRIGEILSPMLGETAIHNFLQGMFQNPRSLDDIFDFFFSFLGISFKAMLDMEADEEAFSQFTGALQSSTFFLGITLDRYFFTPFGHYFKLIQPVYALPFDFNGELEFLHKTLRNPNEDVASALYSPCASYLLTSLGKDLFHIESDEEGLMLSPETKQVMRKLLRTGFDNNNLTEEEIARLYLMETNRNTSDIYEIKVKLSDNKTYWKNFEIPGHLTLHDFFNRICFEFDLDTLADYSFFIDDSENRFTAYYSPDHKKRAKKADEITLKQLNFAPKHKFSLNLYNTIDPFTELVATVRTLKLELEILKQKKPGYDKVYPRVSRESQAFKDLFLDLWF